MRESEMRKSSTSQTASGSGPSPLTALFKSIETIENLPESSIKKDAYSDLIRSLLKVHHIETGRISCFLTVKAPVANVFNTLHGGVVAAVSELVATACARTVFAADEGKELFLGEMSTAYLSGAGINVELEVDGSIVKRGRNVIVTSVEFRIKKTGKIAYSARATFYNMPIAKL